MYDTSLVIDPYHDHTIHFPRFSGDQIMIAPIVRLLRIAKENYCDSGSQELDAAFALPFSCFSMTPLLPMGLGWSIYILGLFPSSFLDSIFTSESNRASSA